MSTQQKDVNWKELERVWEETDQHDKPMQMSLFYGGDNITTEEHTTTDADTAPEEHPGQNSPSPGGSTM